MITLAQISTVPLGYAIVRSDGQWWDPAAKTWGAFAASKVTALTAADGHATLRVGTAPTPLAAGLGAAVVLFDITTPAAPVVSAVPNTLDAATTGAAWGLVAAAAAGSVTLDVAPAFDLTGCVVSILDGTGRGQARPVTAWNAGTKTATVTPAWTVTPAAGDAYCLYADGPADYQQRGVAVTLPGTVPDSAGTATLLDRLSAARATKLDHLDAAVSTRSTYAGGPVASVTAAVTLPAEAPSWYAEPPDAAAIAVACGAVTLDAGAVAASPAPTASTFSATGPALGTLGGAYTGMSVLFTAGTLQGVKRDVQAHAVAAGLHSFALAAALPTPPVAGDTFLLV